MPYHQTLGIYLKKTQATVHAKNQFWKYQRKTFHELDFETDQGMFKKIKTLFPNNKKTTIRLTLDDTLYQTHTFTLPSKIPQSALFNHIKDNIEALTNHDKNTIRYYYTFNIHQDVTSVALFYTNTTIIDNYMNSSKKNNTCISSITADAHSLIKTIPIHYRYRRSTLLVLFNRLFYYQRGCLIYHNSHDPEHAFTTLISHHTQHSTTLHAIFIQPSPAMRELQDKLKSDKILLISHKIKQLSSLNFNQLASLTT